MTSTAIITPTPHSPLVVSFGGGVNSSAMILLLRHHGIRPQAVLFADTGGEKPSTYQFIRESMSPYLRAINWPPITAVRGHDVGKSTLEDACLAKAALPSLAYGYKSCADKWKKRPQRTFLRTWPPALAAWAAHHTVTFAIGYDAGETHRRALPDTRNFSYLYPLRTANWGRQECLDAIRTAGLPIPPKSACFFCPSTTKAAILRLYRCHPDLAERACRIEQVAYASGRAHRPGGLARHWSWTDLIAAETRKSHSLSSP